MQNKYIWVNSQSNQIGTQEYFMYVDKYHKNQALHQKVVSHLVTAILITL